MANMPTTEVLLASGLLLVIAVVLVQSARRSMRKAGKQVMDHDPTATKENEPFSGSGPWSGF